jgi:hypothetical protein
VSAAQSRSILVSDHSLDGPGPRRRTVPAAAVRCFPAGFLDHMNQHTEDDNVGVIVTERV